MSGKEDNKEPTNSATPPTADDASWNPPLTLSELLQMTRIRVKRGYSQDENIKWMCELVGTLGIRTRYDAVESELPKLAHSGTAIAAATPDIKLADSVEIAVTEVVADDKKSPSGPQLRPLKTSADNSDKPIKTRKAKQVINPIQQRGDGSRVIVLEDMLAGREPETPTAEPPNYVCARLVLSCSRENIADGPPLCAECNGVVIDTSTWFPLAIPPRGFNSRVSQSKITEKLSKGMYDIIRVDDGTVLTLYPWQHPVDGEVWGLASSNGYDVSSLRWMGPLTYAEAVYEIFKLYPDFIKASGATLIHADPDETASTASTPKSAISLARASSGVRANPIMGTPRSSPAVATVTRIDCPNLDRNYCYTFGFRHHDFHPLRADPQRMWFIQSTRIGSTPVPADDASASDAKSSSASDVKSSSASDAKSSSSGAKLSAIDTKPPTVDGKSSAGAELSATDTKLSTIGVKLSTIATKVATIGTKSSAGVKSSVIDTKATTEMPASVAGAKAPAPKLTTMVGIPAQQVLAAPSSFTSYESLIAGCAASLEIAIKTIASGVRDFRPHYGYILRRNASHGGAEDLNSDLLIESALLRVVRTIAYEKPDEEANNVPNGERITHKNRWEYNALRAFLSINEQTRTNFIGLYPEFKDRYEKYGVFCADLVKNIIKVMRSDALNGESSEKVRKMSALARSLAAHIRETEPQLDPFNADTAKIVGDFVLIPSYAALFLHVLTA